jgi:sirohydrochlorin ferrochelatase
MDSQEIPTHSPSVSAQTAVLLIAHGSREPSANDDLHELAARLSASGEYPIVEACFLELAQPDIPAGGDHCVSRGATRVLMVPYFLSAGVHLRRDLTAARDDLARRFPLVEFLLGRPLGPHPLLDSLVAARAHELDGRVMPDSRAASSANSEVYVETPIAVAPDPPDCPNPPRPNRH